MTNKQLIELLQTKPLDAEAEVLLPNCGLGANVVEVIVGDNGNVVIVGED